MIIISPSTIESCLSCFRKHFFKSVLRLPVKKTPWQGMGIDGHRTIESYMIDGSMPETDFCQKVLQVVLPILPEPPSIDAEVELRVNLPYTKRRPKKAKPNRVVEFDQWVGRTDLTIHQYVDLWPFPDEMDTWDWKFRANLSFKNTPVCDLRTDPQAVMYQLMRSYFLTKGWEEPGRHTWQVIDRKQWRREDVHYDFAQGEALERWGTVLEPAIDYILEVYGQFPNLKKADPALIPDNGYYFEDDRECKKWGGCDHVRRCMGYGTPVFGALTGFLRDMKRKRPR